MPLNYDLRNVKADWENDDVWPVTNSLIWGTMSVGMGQITKKNWQEFYTRCHIIETIHGNWLVDKEGKARWITPDDVESHIGLYTNASTLTKAAFKNSIDRRLRQQAKDAMRK